MGFDTSEINLVSSQVCNLFIIVPTEIGVIRGWERAQVLACSILECFPYVDNSFRNLGKVLNIWISRYTQTTIIRCPNSANTKLF